jgi:hypothetical protein
MRERHDVVFTHLHPLCRNAPLGLFVVEIKFMPLRFAQLPGTHEHEGRESQCLSHNKSARIRIDRTKECTRLLGIGYPA